jgi:hypothetical protein
VEIEDAVDGIGEDQQVSVRRIPVEADVLVAYSVAPGKRLGYELILHFLMSTGNMSATSTCSTDIKLSRSKSAYGFHRCI